MPNYRRGLQVAAVVLLAGGCGSSSPSGSSSSSSSSSALTSTGPTATTASAVNFSAGGQPAYGALGPEGIPLEAGPALAPINPAVTGQTVDAVSCNATEQLAYHHHAHLVVFVNGVGQSVPLAIGIMPQVGVDQTQAGPFAASSTTCFYWLHVHAADGVIHIESPTAGTFTLGQLFAVWGQPISASQVGPAQGAVTATVNGHPFSGNPADIPLNERAQVVLNVGGPIVIPPPIDWSPTQL